MAERLSAVLSLGEERRDSEASLFPFTNNSWKFDARGPCQYQLVVQNSICPAGFLHLDFNVPKSKTGRAPGENCPLAPR